MSRIQYDALSVRNSDMVRANVKGNLNVLSVERKITNLEEYNRPFSLDELRKSLDKAHDTACVPDDIDYQLLKHLPESALQVLLDLRNDIWETGDLPSIWKLANVIPIPKPGKDISEPSNYQPIALTTCVCKTMERRINARLWLVF